MARDAARQPCVDEEAPGWRVDRHIPLALVMAIVVQTVAVGIWIGMISSRLSEVEKKVDGLSGYYERVIRMEADVYSVKTSVGKIETLLLTRPYAYPPPDRPFQPARNR